MSGLKCSVSECKKRLNQVNSMTFTDLEKQNTKCANCGEWLIKDEKIANETYNAVSNKWAEKFMKNMIARR